MPIPKIVHLTWKDKSIPEKWKRCVASWKKTNPDWEIRLWTDADNRAYIQGNYPDFLGTFDGYIYPIQRADAIRYFLLRDFGGIYADMDIEILGSMNTYFDHAEGDAFLVQSGNVPVFTNCFMASKPGARFWDEVIERLRKPRVPWYAFTKHFIVMYSTGPLMLNRVANESKHIIQLLPKTVFMSYSIADESDVVKPRAILKNLNEGSWNSLDSLILNFLFKYGWSVLLFLLSLCIVYLYTKKIGIPQVVRSYLELPSDISSLKQSPRLSIRKKRIN